MNKYKYISSATTTTVGTQSNGVLSSVIIGETSAGAITISDSKGTIAVLKASILEGVYEFKCAYSGYLTIVTDGASKLSIMYQ